MRLIFLGKIKSKNIWASEEIYWFFKNMCTNDLLCISAMEWMTAVKRHVYEYVCVCVCESNYIDLIIIQWDQLQ